LVPQKRNQNLDSTMLLLVRNSNSLSAGTSILTHSACENLLLRRTGPPTGNAEAHRLSAGEVPIAQNPRWLTRPAALFTKGDSMPRNGGFWERDGCEEGEKSAGVSAEGPRNPGLSCPPPQ
jgi:hypothetical protein